MRSLDSARVSYTDWVSVWLPSLEKCRRHSWPLNKRRNMSGPIVSRAQTPGGDVQIGVTLGCVICNRTDKLLRCSRCKAVFYCTKEHQRRDWKRHKEFCATHSVESIVSDTVSAASQNSILKSTKKDSSVRNCHNSIVPVVSNLSEKSVLERTRESSTAPVYNDGKRLGGIWNMILFSLWFSQNC